MQPISQRLAQLEGLLQEDPSNILLIVETVNGAVEEGQLDRAESIVNRLPEEAAADPAVVHARGMLALARHQFQEAAAIFGELISRIPAPQIRFNYAYALFRLRDYEGAAAVLEGLQNEADAQMEVLAYLMRCVHHLGDPRRALELWGGAPPARKTGQAAGVASLAALDSNRLTEARALAELGLAVNSPEALVVKATLAVGDGVPDQAVDMLDRARALAPNDGRVWSAMGAARMLQGEVAAAADAFNRATELMPGHVGAWLSLAWCQILLSQLDPARSTLERALEIDRNFAEVHGALAVIAALEGRADEARALIERAQRLDRDGLSAKYALAVLDGKAHDAKAVQTLARKLLRARPGIDGEKLLERELRNIGGGPR